jgi:hypothetical protein
VGIKRGPYNEISRGDEHVLKDLASRPSGSFGQHEHVVGAAIEPLKLLVCL